MTPECDWASCHLPGIYGTGAWRFCRAHQRDDLAMRKGLDPRPAQLPKDVAPCGVAGSDAGYQRHRKEGEQPCIRCAVAANQVRNDRKRAQRERGAA